MTRAILVDDEQPAANKLKKMLTETGGIEILGAFTDSAEALAFARLENVDAAFLDIDMPVMNGFELANALLETNPKIYIIFVTAYSEYAVEAFRLNALDYLLKPVEKERLAMSVLRIPQAMEVPEPEEKTLRALCFGKFRVEIGGSLLKFRTAKAEELLAYLIDQNGKPVHRNRIIDEFWMDYDGDRGMILFNTTLHYLKKAAADRGLQLKIDYNRGTYQMNMSGVYCDAYDFMSRAASLGQADKKNIRLYEKTIALYTGEYFEQNEFGWAAAKRADIKEAYAALVLSASGFYLSQGQSQKALSLLKEGISKDPLSRALNFAFLKQLNVMRDTASLLKHFELYKSRLNTEVGIEPDQELKSIAGNLK